MEKRWFERKPFSTGMKLLAWLATAGAACCVRRRLRKGRPDEAELGAEVDTATEYALPHLVYNLAAYSGLHTSPRMLSV